MNKKKPLNSWEQTVRKRIIYLIDNYCDGSQQKFVEKTGINKGSVSQYVNGKNLPSDINIDKIAAAFNVDPGWLLASDIIPPGIDISEPEPDPDRIAKAMDLLDRVEKLSPENQKLFLEFLDRFPSDS